MSIKWVIFQYGCHLATGKHQTDTIFGGGGGGVAVYARQSVWPENRLGIVLWVKSKMTAICPIKFLSFET